LDAVGLVDVWRRSIGRVKQLLTLLGNARPKPATGS
jgi:hypothetical protein